MRALLSASAALLLLIACGGEGEVGDECDVAGQTEDECTDGAICTNDSSGDGNTCRKLCTDQDECAAGENCNGISGTSQKSCQPE